MGLDFARVVHAYRTGADISGPAIQRMFERGITEADVRHVLGSGEVIETYPDDTPHPSRLVLEFRSTRPIHVVAADNPQQMQTIEITVYEPDPVRWDPTFRARRSR